MGTLIRLARALPLVLALAALAGAAYLVLAWTRSPDRARAVVIRLLAAVTGLLTALFCLASAYALFEGNGPVLDLFGGFAAVSALSLGVVLLRAWRYARSHPGFALLPRRPGGGKGGGRGAPRGRSGSAL